LTTSDDCASRKPRTAGITFCEAQPSTRRITCAPPRSIFRSRAGLRSKSSFCVDQLNVAAISARGHLPLADQVWQIVEVYGESSAAGVNNFHRIYLPRAMSAAISAVGQGKCAATARAPRSRHVSASSKRVNRPVADNVRTTQAQEDREPTAPACSFNSRVFILRNKPTMFISELKCEILQSTLPVIPPKRSLEIKFEAKLDEAWITRRGNVAEIGAGYISDRVEELGVIQ
jgi:hypothetical protein